MTRLRPETFNKIETLVSTALVLGEAAINCGKQPPYKIEFAASVEYQGQNWLTVKATYKGLCCLLDPSHPQKNQKERTGQRRKMGDLLKKLREAGLLEDIVDGVHNISRKAGCYFCLKLNFKDCTGSQRVLRERLGVGIPTALHPFLPASSASGIDDYVLEIRQQLREFIQEEHGQVRVFGIPQPVKVVDIYAGTDIWQQIINRRWQRVSDFLQTSPLDFLQTSPLEGLNRLVLSSGEPSRHSGWQIAKKYQRLMVWGKPGIGKTTYLQYLCTRCIESSPDSEDAFWTDKIPIFVQLSQFEQAIYKSPDKTLDLLDFIQFSWRRWGIEADLPAILNAGRALLLLDGQDEVLIANDESVTYPIRDFIDRYPKNSFLITCRIAADRYGFAMEKFKEIEVADFDREQAEYFILQWFNAQLRDQPELAQSRVESLIGTLNMAKHRPIWDLAVTPLLLNLICLVFQGTGDLPSVRFKLYEQATDVLLEEWDQHRDVHRDLILPNLTKAHLLELILRTARTMFEQYGRVIEKHQVQQLICNYLKSLKSAPSSPVELQEASKVVLNGIISHYGLLVERANGTFSFSHLTFQEYFTARSIHLEQDWETLLMQICNSQWREVFLLVAEMQSDDHLVCAMTQKIHDTFATQAELQSLLAWVDQRATHASKTLPYKPAALRTWYFSQQGCNLDEGVESFRKSGQASECFEAISLAQSLGLDQGLAADVLEAQILYQRLIAALGLVAGEQTVTDLTDLIEALSFLYSDRFLDGLLPAIKSIKPLLNQMNDVTSLSQKNLFLSWWPQPGKRWALEVIEGHRFWKSDEGTTLYPESPPVSKELKKQYYNAILLLLDCMRRRQVSSTLEQQVENTILLPNEGR